MQGFAAIRGESRTLAAGRAVASGFFEAPRLQQQDPPRHFWPHLQWWGEAYSTPTEPSPTLTEAANPSDWEPTMTPTSMARASRLIGFQVEEGRGSSIKRSRSWDGSECQPDPVPSSGRLIGFVKVTCAISSQKSRQSQPRFFDRAGLDTIARSDTKT